MVLPSWKLFHLKPVACPHGACLVCAARMAAVQRHIVTQDKERREAEESKAHQSQQPQLFSRERMGSFFNKSPTKTQATDQTEESKESSDDGVDKEQTKETEQVQMEDSNQAENEQSVEDVGKGKDASNHGKDMTTETRINGDCIKDERNDQCEAVPTTSAGPQSSESAQDHTAKADPQSSESSQDHATNPNPQTSPGQRSTSSRPEVVEEEESSDDDMDVSDDSNGMD